MTADAYEDWIATEAAQQWKRTRDNIRYPGYVMREVYPRTLRVIEDEATDREASKVFGFIRRHRRQEAGEKILGAGKHRVSKQTAALRWWGFDPTGRFR